ncbi:unnamed protein product [Prunus armeniaca]|uniref:Uncharacterized protein n=1 Tax=Prunus armeniaca TaxID=36596 RepID=A0A6J5V0Z2_PRUAR|nr:unnamed protein product [Prunus armeniaca]CAB4311476.1 unnamed protein product [Prunus armeniaca]
MDLLMERLESDVDKIMHHKLQLKPSDYLTDEEDEFKEEEDDEGTTFDPHRFVTEAAACFVTKHPTASHAARSILLCESIAKRLFTPESDQSMNWKSGRSLGNWFWRPCAIIGIVKECLTIAGAGCLRSRSCGIFKPQLTVTGRGAMRLRSIWRRCK